MTDWQVGDWALDGLSGCTLRVMQVTGIVDECVMLENGTENTLVHIPVCEEILEKNGWEWCAPYWTLKRDVRLGWNPKTAEFVLGWTRLPYAVLFVDKVQHILRVCGMRDEADNFKI